MGKIYDKAGNVMSTQQIFGEISNTITTEQARAVNTALKMHTGSNCHRNLSHAILDCYAMVDGTTEQGARMRKLLDKVMTKFQKSTTPLNKEDESACHSLICDINRKAE